MGLHKVMNTKYGADATYWNIARIDVNKKESSTEVVLDGYLSKETRLAGKDPILSKTFTFYANDPVQFDVDPTNANAKSLWTAAYLVLTDGVLPAHPIYQASKTGEDLLDANGRPILDEAATAAQPAQPFCEFYGAPEDA